MTSPPRPVNIRSSRPSSLAEGISSSFAGTPIGTPDLRALRAQYAAASTPPPNIPPRTTGTPTLLRPLPVTDLSLNARLGFNGVGGISARRPSTPSSGYDANRVDLGDLPDEEKAKVLRRHLVSREERQAGSESDVPEQEVSRQSSMMFAQGSGIQPHQRQDTDPFPVPYDAPGADVTHDIYKWQSDQRRQGMRVRAASFAGTPPAPTDPAFEHIHEPGGFRRNYVLLRANAQGTEEPRILNNFIDFLFIFGHFAGEDLEEDEDDDKIEDEEAGVEASSSGMQPTEVSERQPLLGTSKLSKSRSRSRRRRLSVTEHGDATFTQAVLMLLKSFVGTGVLFLGKAFYNGGILFSALTLAFICLISLYSFLLLVQAKFVVPGSFGGIGGALYGPWMRLAILTSITISQIGFVAAYTIFVSQNLQAFVMAITHCLRLISLQYFILMQLVIFLPLALIRNLAKLGTTALVADAFILAGLIYIFGSEVAVIAKNGPAEVKLFNSKDFPLFIGTAVFSFEGVGLVIPITDSMREPRKFPAALTGVMILLLFLFGGAGVLSYLAFGSDIQTVVIVNLDSESKLTQAVQFLYSLAILLSVPLQLFPAVRIMENGIFIKRSGKADTRIKWLKNLFRCAIVFMCAAISWAGAKDLDKFVAFVGSFACVPLCYIYPAMIHYKACAKTWKEKVADIALMVFGLVAAVYTTVQTIRLMMVPESRAAPKFGHCDVPPAAVNPLSL